MRRLHWLAAVAVVFLAPLLAHAQERAPSLEALSRTLPPTEDVWLTDATGKETKVRILSVSGSIVSMMTREGQRDLAVSDVGRVRRKYNDPVWNGAAIGFFSSIAYPVWYFSQQYESGESLGENWEGIVIGGMLGAAIGAVIDSRIKGKRVVYERPAGTANLRIAPMMDRRGAGVQVTIGFTPAAR